MIYKRYFLRIIKPVTDEINLLKLYNSFTNSLQPIVLVKLLLLGIYYFESI